MSRVQNKTIPSPAADESTAALTELANVAAAAQPLASIAPAIEPVAAAKVTPPAAGEAIKSPTDTSAAPASTPTERTNTVRHMAAGYTAIGQVKARNEDAFMIEPGLGAYVVCDGMGGRPSGHIASKTACKLLRQSLLDRRETLDAFRDNPDPDHRQAAIATVRQAVTEVSDAIFRAGQKDAKLRGMATTLVVLVITGKNAIIAHAGDSRAYLIRGMQPYLLTDDHSVVNRQLQRGLITPEDALHSSKAHAVTRAVGLHEELEPTLLNVELMPGDTFLLCTDGLSRYITTEEIGRAGTVLSPQMMSKRLVQLADDRSGRDNITAVSVKVDPNQTVDGLNAAQKIEALRKIPLFQGLSYKEAIRILSIVSSRSYAAGEKIIAQGEVGSEFYVGALGSFRVILDGQELTTLRAGSFFGEMALVGEQTRAFDVYAAEFSRVLVISRGDMHQLLQGEPHLASKFLWAFCRVLAERTTHMGKELAKVRFEVDNQLDDQDMTAPFDLSHLAFEVEKAQQREDMAHAAQQPTRPAHRSPQRPPQRPRS